MTSYRADLKEVKWLSSTPRFGVRGGRACVKLGLAASVEACHREVFAADTIGQYAVG
ncbi:MAG: hypothetical protein WCI87_09015 [Euryarchaeota archaeon]